MNTIIWICQGFLAAVFLYSGFCKSSKSEQWLVSNGQTGVEGLPIILIRFIGIVEVLGAIGLILPKLINIIPILTSLAATGFAIIMVSAALIHFKRKEYKSVMFNIFIFLLSLLVAWNRYCYP